MAMKRFGFVTAVLLCPAGCYQARCPPPILIDPSGTKGRRLPQQIRVIADVPYRSDALYYNTLDLYLPARRNAPVVMYVHGCYWTRGDKTIDSHLGRWFASNGIAAAVVNYRLPPHGRYPEEIGDVAKAF